MPKTVQQTKYGGTLDITGYKLTKPLLQIQIIEDVKDTRNKRLYVPDKIVMTQDQYNLLSDETQRMEGSTDRFYRTGMNVMEVKVVA